MPRITSKYQKLGRGKEGYSPRTFTESMAWSSFQKFETINFCCFKPTQMWYLVMAGLETQQQENRLNSLAHKTERENYPTRTSREVTLAQLQDTVFIILHTLH